MIKVRCKGCGVGLNAAEEQVGKRLACPKCGAQILVEPPVDPPAKPAEPISPPGKGGDWYVHLGREQGPFTASQLKAFADTGKITRDTRVKKGVDGGWVAASNVKGLFAAASVPPAVPQSATDVPPAVRQSAGEVPSALPQAVDDLESPRPKLSAVKTYGRFGSRSIIGAIAGSIIVFIVAISWVWLHFTASQTIAVTEEARAEPDVSASVSPNTAQVEGNDLGPEPVANDVGSSDATSVLNSPQPPSVTKASFSWGERIESKWEDGSSESEYRDSFGRVFMRIRGDKDGLREKAIYSDKGDSELFCLKRADDGKLDSAVAGSVGNPTITWSLAVDTVVRNLRLRNLSDCGLTGVTVHASLMDKDANVIIANQFMLMHCPAKSAADIWLTFDDRDFEAASVLQVSLKQAFLELPQPLANMADVTEFYAIRNENGKKWTYLSAPDGIEPLPVFIGGELKGEAAAAFRVHATQEPTCVEIRKNPSASVFEKAKQTWESKFKVDNIVLASGVTMNVHLENYIEEDQRYSRWSWDINLVIPSDEFDWYKAVLFAYAVGNNVQTCPFSDIAAIESEGFTMQGYTFKEIYHVPIGNRSIITPIDSLLRQMVSLHEVKYRLSTGPEGIGPTFEGTLSPRAIAGISEILKKAKYPNECHSLGGSDWRYEQDWMEPKPRQ